MFACLVHFFLIEVSIAQIIFDKYGAIDNVYAAEAPDGNLIVCNRYPVLYKLDNTGTNIIWAKDLGKPSFPSFNLSSNEDGKKFIFDNDGNMLITGSYSGGEAVLKVDNNGNVISQVKSVEYQGNNPTFAGCYIEKTLTPNQFIVCGQNSLFNPFFNSFFMKLIDANGDMLWYKEYVNAYAGPYGNTVRSVKPTTDGGYILTGTSKIPDYCNNIEDIFVLKTDAWGSIQWVKEYAFFNHNHGMDIVEIGNGNFLVLNKTEIGGLLMRIDASGNVIWGKIYYTQNELFGLNFTKMENDNDGVVIAARCMENITGDECDYLAALLKVDYDGNVVWAERYSSEDLLLSVSKTSDNGFILAGEGGLLIKTNHKGESKCSYPILVESTFVTPFCAEESDFYVSNLGYQQSYNYNSTPATIELEDVCCTFTPVISGNTYLCDNNPVTLDAGYYPGATYYWSPGGQTSQVITVNTPGTYQVIITDQNGCIGKANVVVSVGSLPSPPQIIGSNLVCDGTPNYCISPFNPALQYTWSAPNAQSVTPYNNDECAVIVWNNAGGLITVTVTDPTTGCTNTATFKVNPCCDGIINGVAATFTNRTASSVLNDPNYSSFIAGNMVTTFGTGGGNMIAINGTFTVDVDINFSNAELVLNPEAEIIINDYITFSTGDNSYIHSCLPEMWKRIFINPYANALINLTIIEDGKNAVESYAGGNFTIENATFNKNRTGVFVNTFVLPHTGTIKKTTFQCTANLLTPYTGLRSDIGVHIANTIVQNGIDITIGDPSSPQLKNIFENHNTGIRVTNANASIFNNEFKNCLTLFIPFNTQGPGVGIHSLGANEIMQVNIGNGNTSHQNIFTNCSYGIIAERKHNVNIQKNQFNTIQFRGITVQNMLLPSFPFPPNVQVLVKNNTLNNAATGIYLYNNPNATVLVQENTINLAGVPLTGGTGISGFEFNISASTNTTTLLMNTINNPRRGIEMTGFDRLLVRQNYINNQKTSPVFSYMPSYGIRLQGCGRVRALSNSIKVQSPQSNTNIFGLSVEMCSDALVDCNETKFTGTGLRAAGQMPHSQFWTNKMQSHYNGFVLWSNSSIPKQYRPGPGSIEWPSDNTWFGNFNCRTSVITGSPSPIFVARTTPPFYNPSSPPLCNQVILNAPSQVVPYLCPYIVQKPSFPGLMQQIAKGQFPSGDTLKWLARQQALWNINTDSTYWSDTLLIQFRDSALLSNMGTLHYLDSLVNNASACTQASLSQLNTINPVNNIEKNMRDILQICIPNILNGSTTLNQQQISVLQSIAALCPFEDGMAVYQARMLLQPYDSTYYINFCETYPDNNMRISTPSDEEENPLPQFGEVQFSVYPNPAAGEVNVAYKLVDNKSHAQVMLYNYTGEVVYSYTIAGITGNVRISTQHFASGVYLLRIEGYEGLLYSEKLVILK